MPMRNWIDGHLDLAYLAVNGRDMAAPSVDPEKGCVTLPVVREAGIGLAIGTIFTEPGVFGPDHPHGYPASDDLDAAEAAGLAQAEVYQQWEHAGLIRIVRRGDDLPQPGQPDGALRVLILMEGADPIRSPDAVLEWRERGVRMVGLTWATGSRYSGGNGDGGPLTPRGAELVKALDAAGIIHDASHLSDAAFDAVMGLSKGPIVASHSNCRSLLEPRQRHLRDDQIKAIAARNGIVGLNLYSAFLAKGRRATIDDAVAHIQHVAGVMGHRQGVGLGSDMDGGFPPKDLPEGLDHPGKLEALAEGLRHAGWNDQEIDGFAWGNWLRFLQGSLG